MDHCGINLTCLLLVDKTHQPLHYSDSYELEKPDLLIKVGLHIYFLVSFFFFFSISSFLSFFFLSLSSRTIPFYTYNFTPEQDDAATITQVVTESERICKNLYWGERMLLICVLLFIVGSKQGQSERHFWRGSVIQESFEGQPDKLCTQNWRTWYNQRTRF